MAPANKKFYKKYLKTLQWGQGHPRETKELLKAAPSPVIKLLSNAAIVAAKGKVKLSPKQREAFRRKKQLFSVLTDKQLPIEKKRQYLVQRGGGWFVPLLLSTVLPAAGSLLFDFIKNKLSPQQ